MTDADSNGALLAVEDLVAGYVPEVDILTGVDLTVREGEIVTVIGPNGAGKSTLIKSIFGLLPPRRGRVILRGEDLTGLRPHSITRRGMSYVPQLDNIFQSLTVEENLEMGALDPSRLADADGPGVRPLSPPWRAPHPDGRDDERGRAPAARNGKGADARPGGPAARRTLGRPGARLRRSDLRQDRGDQPGGRDPRDGRAERAPSPGHVEPRLRTRSWDRTASRVQAGSCWRTPRSPSSTLAARRD